jgi:hypothetical protein
LSICLVLARGVKVLVDDDDIKIDYNDVNAE